MAENKKQAMKITGFFKVTKPKQFAYNPRYYNPLKEEREERNRQIREELGIKNEKPYTPDLRGKLTSQFADKYRKKNKMPLYRKIILIMTLVLVLAIVYLAYYISVVMSKNG